MMWPWSLLFVLWLTSCSAPSGFWKVKDGYVSSSVVTGPDSFWRFGIALRRVRSNVPIVLTHLGTDSLLPLPVLNHVGVLSDKPGNNRQLVYQRSYGIKWCIWSVLPGFISIRGVGRCENPKYMISSTLVVIRKHDGLGAYRKH